MTLSGESDSPSAIVAAWIANPWPKDEALIRAGINVAVAFERPFAGTANTTGEETGDVAKR